MIWRIVCVVALVLSIGACGPKKKATEPGAVAEHQKAVEKELRELGVSVRELADSIVLEGTVKTQEAKEQAEEIAKELGDRVTSAIEVLKGEQPEPSPTPTPTE